MTKVLGAIAGFAFALFGIAIIGLMVSLTYQALGRIFPDSFANQMWGLIVFDIAVICWALGFVYKSKSVIQYGAAGAGFLVAFTGTLGMVAAEVILSGNLADVDTVQIGQWMVYGFIAVTAVHVSLLWIHHGGAPEIHQQINIGIARGEITTEAIKMATQALESNRAAIARDHIQAELYNQALRDLDIPIPASGTVFEPATQPLPPPAPQPQPERRNKQNFLSRIRNGLERGGRLFHSNVQSVTPSTRPQTPDPSPVQGDAEPAAIEGSGQASTPDETVK